MKVRAFHRIDGQLGVVNDTMFIGCFWPKLDAPTELFSPVSSGIVVMCGTPRNVLFPEGTEFRDYFPDALYPAEQAVMTMGSGTRRGLLNLSDDEAAVWLKVYEHAAKNLPATAAKFQTRNDCFFLRDKREKSRRTKTLSDGSTIEKIEHDEFIAEIPPEHARKPHDVIRRNRHHNDFIPSTAKRIA